MSEYPVGIVSGPCICGSWPGGECLKCPKINGPAPHPWGAALTEDHCVSESDHCSISAGARGGVRGNENIVAGIVVCDYCLGDALLGPDVT